jgi:hypothetical protein
LLPSLAVVFAEIGGVGWKNWKGEAREGGNVGKKKSHPKRDRYRGRMARPARSHQVQQCGQFKLGVTGWYRLFVDGYNHKRYENMNTPFMPLS